MASSKSKMFSIANFNFGSWSQEKGLEAGEGAGNCLLSSLSLEPEGPAHQLCDLRKSAQPS